MVPFPKIKNLLSQENDSEHTKLLKKNYCKVHRVHPEDTGQTEYGIEDESEGDIPSWQHSKRECHNACHNVKECHNNPYSYTFFDSVGSRAHWVFKVGHRQRTTTFSRGMPSDVAYSGMACARRQMIPPLARMRTEEHSGAHSSSGKWQEGQG